jgi:hypothetical protein
MGTINERGISLFSEDINVLTTSPPPVSLSVFSIYFGGLNRAL